jgi:hypothetical protein
MMEGEEMVDYSVLGVGRKSVEQWCFSIGGKKVKQLLDRVVSSMKDDEEMKKVV